MKNITYAVLLSILSFTSCKHHDTAVSNNQTNESVAIVPSADADTIEKFAAAELSSYLSKIYPDYTFPVQKNAGKGKAIFLDVMTEASGLTDNPEGYQISSNEETARIVSKGSTGLVYGVYAILESLGCGFYLSDEMLPEPKKHFDFEGWELSDEPLIPRRFVFNWHNFISGCSGWDKAHWLEWIDRSQKIGYNTIMVHTYHNNPMHTYQFNGLEKEVGYINTSAKGRDWGNIPINDVRRLPGGEIFDAAEFGSEIAMVPDDQRVKVAQETMAEVFDYAVERGVKVNFSFDIDMPISFLQDSMIQSIPESDRFYVPSLKKWFPDPDRPQGYAFYKAQLVGLLETYESIDEISFFRRGSTFFKYGKLEEFPEDWRDEHSRALKTHPYLAEIDEQELLAAFISSRLVRTYQKILKEMGRSDIPLATGSWTHKFVVPTAAFLPTEIDYMPIDWESRFDKSFMEDDEILADFASAECAERVVPFIWAHHDDGRHIGRPYKPTVNLKTRLDMGRSKAFGVFHWMNRPLDLFFKNMSRQVWKATENETMERTCTMMAKHYFGTEALETYFTRWMNEAPMFGRATHMNFFYRRQDDANFDFEKAIVQCRERIRILDEADTSEMTQQQLAYIDYFKTLEQFIIDFSEVQPHFLKAEELLNKGDLEGAQAELGKGNPEVPVKTFSKLSRIAKDERGEMAYAYRFATKYIPDFRSFEQRTRLKPILINMDSVVYEELAQGNKINFTYHVDKDGAFWECLGQEEFESKITKLSGPMDLNRETQTFSELFEYGLRINASETIPIRPVMRAFAIKNADHLWEGSYRLTLLLATEDGKEVDFSINMNGSKTDLKASGVSLIRETIEHTETGPMSLIIEPADDVLILCGLMLEPI